MPTNPPRRMLEDVRASAELSSLMNRCGRWACSVMHVVREGRVLQTVTGWPREGRAAELLAAVRAADVEGACRAP